MTVKIPNELADSLLAAVKVGRFATLDDALAEAVRRLVRESSDGGPPPENSGSPADRAPSSEHTRAKRAIALLDSWLSDESVYDEATWPALKRTLDEARPACRRLFSDDDEPVPPT